MFYNKKMTYSNLIIDSTLLLWRILSGRSHFPSKCFHSNNCLRPKASDNGALGVATDIQMADIQAYFALHMDCSPAFYQTCMIGQYYPDYNLSWNDLYPSRDQTLVADSLALCVCSYLHRNAELCTVLLTERIWVLLPPLCSANVSS